MTPKVTGTIGWMEAVRAGCREVECGHCGWIGERFPVHMLTCELTHPDYVSPTLGIDRSLPWVVERRTVTLVQQLTAYLAALTLLILAVAIYLTAGYLARGNHWWLMLAPIGFGIQQAGFRHAFTTWRRSH